MYLTDSLIGVGALTVCCFCLRFLRVIYNFTLRRGRTLQDYGAGSNEWAVVTGASDGIGKEFALQLAASGFNVIILARTESKLNEIAETIRSKYNVQAVVIPFDFSVVSSSHFENLVDKISAYPVRVLVNNVGVNYPIGTDFLEASMEDSQNIINVNISSVVILTRLLLPHMMQSKKRVLVINVGSFAGLIAQPMLAIYGASKAFLMSWSQALAKEVEPMNADVVCLSTYFVISNMSRIRRPSFTVPTAKDYVTKVLKRPCNPGGSGLPYASSPYFSHGIMNWALEQVHWEYPKMCLSHYFSKNARQRALKRASRSKSE